MATLWCRVARPTGTTRSKVATPMLYCAHTSAAIAAKATRPARAECRQAVTTTARANRAVRVASRRWSNCTAARFSVRLRRKGCRAA